MTKIESKNSIYPHMHFTEHLVGVFRKPPWKCNSDYETSSVLIRRLKKGAASTSPKNKSQPHRTHLELGATAEPNQVNCLLCDLGGLLTKNTEQAMVQTSTSLWTDQKQVNERVGGRYSPSAGNRWPWID
jgi:hypothetical protein